MKLFYSILSVAFGAGLAFLYVFLVVFPQMNDGYEEVVEESAEYLVNLKEANLIINDNLEACEDLLNPLQEKLKMKRSNLPRYFYNGAWMIDDGYGSQPI